MKKSFVLLLLSLVGYSAFSQSGWVNIRAKQEFRDTVNFTRGFKISGIQVTLNGNEFNILDGALVTVAEINRLVGVTSSVQTQLNNLNNAVNDTITLQTVVMRKHLLINAQTGTAYTLVLADDAKMVTMSNISANTLTVPLNSSVAFPIGTQITIVSINTGQTTIAATSGVTINSAGSALKLRVRYSSCTLIKTATDTWLLIGDITT